MTAPCDPEDAPKAQDEEHEIVLRLGDILPRVPPDLLKPGPHDSTLTVRFTIDELAEKIARGRVSVPLERLSSAFPGVFRDNHTAVGETEVPLPLQRLLDQVGLVARKAAAATSTVPSEQVAQARAEAGRIIEANSTRPVPEFATAPSVHSVRIAKAIFTARQVFGLFPKPGDQTPESSNPESVVNVSTKEPEKHVSAAPANSPSEPSPIEPTPAPEPAAVTIPTISLKALPIFRLLPTAVSRSLPPDDSARVPLPLAAIEPQLAGGHVEIPLEDFAKALPDELRSLITMVPDTQVWIPLDEIFQNLAAEHPFYMPPLDLEPAPEIATGELPAEVPLEAKAEPTTPPETTPEPAASPEPPPATAEAPPAEVPTAPTDAPANQEPQPVSEPNATSTPEAPENAAPPADNQTPSPSAENTPAPAPEPPQAVEVVTAPEPSPIENKEPEPAATPEPVPTPDPAPVQPPTRAPWMRGFQVPPPRVFATASEPPIAADEPPPQPPVETSPSAAATPEAKRTADFLASQTGVIAAAAFVEGAVFASEDFPRKPDLDTLRDFMGTFIGLAEASGRRLGWHRTLTIACEQFHLTAIIRERHFIVALHHDRSLPTAAYDALVLAADDLTRASDSAT